MIKPSTLLLAAFALLAACRPEAPPESPAAPDNYDVFGETISAEGAVPVRTVVDAAEQYDGQTVKLEGTVYEVCQMAGCWLSVDAGDGRYVRVAVPRNDDGSYVFTVPTDISGRHAVVEGALAAVTLDAETREHLAEDAGHAQDGMDHHEGAEGHHENDEDHHEDAEEHHGAEERHEDADSHHRESQAEAGSELHLTAVGVLIQKPNT
jgi:hypothetical protein